MHLVFFSHLFWLFVKVTTFSRQLTAGDIKQLQNITEICNIKLLSLQQFDTEQSFLKEIRSASKVQLVFLHLYLCYCVDHS